MSFKSNEEYHSIASLMANNLVEQGSELRKLVQIAIDAFNQSTIQYLDGIFSQNPGLERCINSIRDIGLAKNPDEFKSFWLPVKDSDFDIDISDIDFRTTFVLFDIVKSRHIHLQQISYVGFEQDHTLTVPIEFPCGSIARLHFNIDNQLCCFINDRDNTSLDLPVRFGQPIANIDLYKLDYGTYDFPHICNISELSSGVETQPEWLVSRLGSSTQFNSLLVTAMVNAMKNRDFDIAIIDSLLESGRINTFTKSPQSLLDIVNQTYPDNFDTFLECAYSITLRSKPVFNNFLPSMLIQTWLDRDVVTSDHKNLMLRLIELNQFKDRGYLATDRVPILIEHYDEVKEHEECLLLSDSINRDIESIFNEDAEPSGEKHIELSMLPNSL
ncbi:hypothetical protein GCM10011607_12360 [Shewanella inventionis]|uniref:Uncharacterized protein n=1 Tax=Shewanella inventionis TaxID=1738770 RepID=A0ABQ1IVU8_9GAMM|nr:hypothetical protein [Shewanella inventionis]GGB53332.1 hypothetical protein GCM10011607_12360 [Shewanella inventionis]